MAQVLFTHETLIMGSGRGAGVDRLDCREMLLTANLSAEESKFDRARR